MKNENGRYYYDLMKDLKTYSLRFSKAGKKCEKVYKNFGVKSFLDKFESGYDRTEPKSLSLTNQKEIERKNKLQGEKKRHIDYQINKLPNIQNHLLNKSDKIEKVQKLLDYKVHHEVKVPEKEKNNIFELKYNKKRSPKKEMTVSKVKQLSNFERQQLKSRERTPELGQYSPRYDSIYKKTPSYAIKPLNTKRNIRSVQQSMTSQLFEKSYMNRSKMSQNSDNDRSLDKDSNLDNSTRSKTSNHKREVKSLIKGIKFENYSSRDFSLKKNEKGSPIGAYYDASNLKKDFKGISFSRMMKRKDLFGKFNYFPGVGDYNPKVSFTKNNYKDFSSSQPKVNYNKLSLQKLWRSYDMSMGLDYKLVKF